MHVQPCAHILKINEQSDTYWKDLHLQREISRVATLSYIYLYFVKPKRSELQMLAKQYYTESAEFSSSTLIERC